MSLLIKNCDIITLDDHGTLFRNANIAIVGQTISAVGNAPPDFRADETIDGYNHVALPGFFNAHCHASMTFERGWAEDLPFPRWLNEKIWVAESALTSDDVYWGAALAACEMIRSGGLAFNDHYFYMDRVAEVVEAAGMKAALAWCVFGIGDEKEIGANLDGTLEFVARSGRSRWPHPRLSRPALAVSLPARLHAARRRTGRRARPGRAPAPLRIAGAGGQLPAGARQVARGAPGKPGRLRRSVRCGALPRGKR